MNPDRTRIFRAHVQLEVRRVLGPARFSGPVALSAAFAVRGRRGDLDNYLKAVLDSLNGVAFEDDSQVVSLTAKFVRFVGVECAWIELVKMGDYVDETSADSEAEIRG